MIRNDCRLSSSAAAGRDRGPSLIADTLRDAANSSGEFDCAGLRELLVGKYAEAKGCSIVKSLLANPGILEGEGTLTYKTPAELKLPSANNDKNGNSIPIIDFI